MDFHYFTCKINDEGIFEKIVLPVDVTANIEGERVDFQIEKLPVNPVDIGIHSIRNLCLRAYRQLS